MPIYVGDDLWIPVSRFDAYIMARQRDFWERWDNANPLEWCMWTLAEASEWERN